MTFETVNIFKKMTDKKYIFYNFIPSKEAILEKHEMDQLSRQLKKIIIK